MFTHVDILIIRNVVVHDLRNESINIIEEFLSQQMIFKANE